MMVSGVVGRSYHGQATDNKNPACAERGPGCSGYCKAAIRDQ